jgi:hypothetical protein
MNRSQAAEFAEATSHWVAFKYLSGLEKLLCEALLITPVAESLLGDSWVLETEGELAAPSENGGI